jgi:putative membrane protein
MTARWLAASLHLLALGIGLGAVWARGRALKSALDITALRQVFLADALWGVAAVIWISTGLWRLLAELEKGTGYYLQNHVFLTKMALLAVVLLLELKPMFTLIRWRQAVARGGVPDTRPAALLARISYVQAGLIVLMVLAATAMARGIGM